MAKRIPLRYKDFKQIKGDTARHYKSESTGEIITLRQFQKLARGYTYTEYVRVRETQGIKQRKYKPRVREPKQRPVRNVAKPDRSAYLNRRDKMQESFARKHGARSFDDITDGEKNDFWLMYQNYVERDEHISEDEWSVYQDDFDLDYEDLYNFPDGDTP